MKLISSIKIIIIIIIFIIIITHAFTYLSVLTKHHNAVNSSIHSFFFYKNVDFPAQAEYPYFSADFRLKIFLYYS